MARAGRDDDDIPPRVGRPRDHEEFGPLKPHPHEREEYFGRLQAILYHLHNGVNRVYLEGSWLDGLYPSLEV
jgi:hypothetical protein